MRFWLSPTPPPEEDESMSRRSERLRKEPKREVYTTESRAGEQIPLPASSHWGRDELKNLGVRFSMTTNMNLDRVLQVKESDFPSELRERTPHHLLLFNFKGLKKDVNNYKLLKWPI